MMANERNIGYCLLRLFFYYHEGCACIQDTDFVKRITCINSVNFFIRFSQLYKGS